MYLSKHPTLAELCQFHNPPERSKVRYSGGGLRVLSARCVHLDDAYGDNECRSVLTRCDCGRLSNFFTKPTRAESVAAGLARHRSHGCTSTSNRPPSSSSNRRTRSTRSRTNSNSSRTRSTSSSRTRSSRAAEDARSSSTILLFVFYLFAACRLFKKKQLMFAQLI